MGLAAAKTYKNGSGMACLVDHRLIQPHTTRKISLARPTLYIKVAHLKVTILFLVFGGWGGGMGLQITGKPPSFGIANT